MRVKKLFINSLKIIIKFSMKGQKSETELSYERPSYLSPVMVPFVTYVYLKENVNFQYVISWLISNNNKCQKTMETIIYKYIQILVQSFMYVYLLWLRIILFCSNQLMRSLIAYLFKSLYGSKNECHFSKKERFPSEDSEKLESHWHNHHTNGDHAEHHHGHHVVTSTPAKFNYKV